MLQKFGSEWLICLLHSSRSKVRYIHVGWKVCPCVRFITLIDQSIECKPSTGCEIAHHWHLDILWCELRWYLTMAEGSIHQIFTEQFVLTLFGIYSFFNIDLCFNTLWRVKVFTTLIGPLTGGGPYNIRWRLLSLYHPCKVCINLESVRDIKHLKDYLN